MYMEFTSPCCNIVPHRVLYARIGFRPHRRPQITRHGFRVALVREMVCLYPCMRVCPSQFSKFVRCWQAAALRRGVTYPRPCVLPEVGQEADIHVHSGANACV